MNNLERFRSSMKNTIETVRVIDPNGNDVTPQKGAGCTGQKTVTLIIWKIYIKAEYSVFLSFHIIFKKVAIKQFQLMLLS